MTLRGLQRLLLILGGKVATQYREIVESVFTRYTKEGSQYAFEVVTLCHNLKFNGSGEKETPCMTLRGLQRLLLILGGKVASQYREIVESVFTGRSRR